MRTLAASNNSLYRDLTRGSKSLSNQRLDSLLPEYPPLLPHPRDDSFCLGTHLGPENWKHYCSQQYGEPQCQGKKDAESSDIGGIA